MNYNNFYLKILLKFFLSNSNNKKLENSEAMLYGERNE